MKNLILTMFAVLAFVSCGHDTIETGNYQQAKQETFVADFNKAFGVTPEVYANHQWGMNLIQFVSPTVTRAHDVNGNLWYQNWERPKNVGSEVSDEVEKVVTEFSKLREGAVNTVNIDWNSYWVQQVFTGTQTYKDGFGSNIGTGSSHMNHLLAYNEVGTTKIVYEQWNNWQGGEVVDHYEHINNFNSGSNGTTFTDDVTHEQFIGTTLMKNLGTTPSGTPKFGYHNSIDSKDHFEYIIIPGSTIFPNNPEMHKYYYVGFDFYATHPDGQEANKNMDVARDWRFNDWIVRISPGEPVNVAPDVDYVRVMCEDLGTDKSDFDYNDIVFDIKFIKEGSTYIADILVQAAGGTLPLTIGGQEVHNLFAEANNNEMISTSTMINTHATVGDHIDGLDPVELTVTLPGSNYATAWDAINDLPIIVLNQNGIPVQLTVNPGSPAEMIAVPVTTAWSNERVSIQSKYPAFVDWIRDSSVQWWE